MQICKLAVTALLALCAALAQQAGTLVGALYDAATGRPIAGAKVEAAGGTVQTDTEGKFTLTVPAGGHTVTFTAPGYRRTQVEGLQVRSGESTDASTVLVSESAVTTVEVTEKIAAVAATEAAALAERRLASVVSDSMSAEEIRRTVASDAAGALEKVTGVSVVEGGYVYVRGLGERYSATMLNNAMLPTTEPEKRVVPLDLFPSSLIEGIKVLKTYSPELPGEFSGGLVQMQTMEFPTTRTMRASVSYGFNTVTSFQRFNGYRGGSTDFFGFDDGTRGLPAIIPRNDRLFVGRFSEQQFQEFGRAFSNNWELEPVESMRPSQTYSLAGGNTFWKGKLGLVGALTFTNQPQRIDELQRFLVNAGGGQPRIFTDYPTFQVHNESARLGAVMNAAYRFNSANKVVFRNTLTRDSDKEGRLFRGLNGGNDNLQESVRLRYIERGLFSTSVEGEHAAARLGNALLRWQFTFSSSERNEPDLRETLRGIFGERTAFLNLPQSGVRFFSDLNDRIYEPLVEVSRPFYKGWLTGLVQVGYRGTLRSRDFQARRFRYVPVRAQTLDFFEPTNQLLRAQNIRPDGFVVREITRATDRYDATMDVHAGYLLADVALGKRWRLVSGARIEDAAIDVITLDPLTPNARPIGARLNNRDLLPAFNLIYQWTGRQNLRMAYSRTLNRPDFRELSPFEFTNVVGGFSTVGNPELRRALIDNLDVRWEWFPGGRELVAVSFFYKRFQDPIEQVYRPTASELRQSFLNVEGARNQGFEFEARKMLGFIHPHLRQLAVSANFTTVSSQVIIPVNRFPQLTSRARPLMGQSRFVGNFIGEWARPKWRSSARFYVHTASRRLSDVGTFQLPDVYQERNTFLDLVYQFDVMEGGKWSLRFTAENLSDNHYRWTQANILVRSFRIGRTFSIGTSFSVF